jgi:hypothetical protein
MDGFKQNQFIPGEYTYGTTNIKVFEKYITVKNEYLIRPIRYKIRRWKMIRDSVCVKIDDSGLKHCIWPDMLVRV